MMTRPQADHLPVGCYLLSSRAFNAGRREAGCAAAAAGDGVQAQVPLLTLSTVDAMGAWVLPPPQVYAVPQHGMISAQVDAVHFSSGCTPCRSPGLCDTDIQYELLWRTFCSKQVFLVE